MDLTPAQIEFHIAEFVALTEERRNAATMAAAHFRWAVVASAALLAWFSTESQDFDIPALATFAPAAIAALLGGHAGVLGLRAGHVGRALFKLEAALGGRPDLGGEEEFAKHKRLLGALTAAAWALLFFADVYGALALQAEALGDQGYETREASFT
jgi:hypothetical protein